MPDVELTEMDLTLLRCLRRETTQGGTGLAPRNLLPCLRERFPTYDEVAMREGESVTRLRGRQLISVDDEGHLALTPNGAELAEGLDMDADSPPT